MSARITTTQELQKYLTRKDIPAAHVDTLSGGTANFVWRITTLLGRTSIVKHAEPFIASNPSIQFPVVRMDFEHKALTTIPSVIPEDDFVHVPGVFHYDADAHVLNIEDGGSRTLKEAYPDESVDVEKVGKGIGRWIAKLHASTMDPELRKQFDSPTAKYIYRHNCVNLASALDEYGFDPALGVRINNAYGSLLQTDDVSVCHGDFWPGNILLSDTISESSGTPSTPLKLTVVDWEMVRNGNGMTDIGQFAAEAWLLDRFRGSRGMLSAFLKGYVGAKETPLEREDQRRIAVQFGTHIAYWTTRVNWASKEETKEVVRIGVEVLEKAEKSDWEWLGGSMLADLFGKTG